MRLLTNFLTNYHNLLHRANGGPAMAALSVLQFFFAVCVRSLIGETMRVITRPSKPPNDERK
jgi:hypothetical protein